MATVVALHAHPDDESLLTGGTLAKLAAEGHRVVLVVATDGMMRGDDEPDPRRRLDELDRAAARLDVADVRWLGYADSGHGAELYADPEGRVRFVRAGVDEPAERLAAVVRDVGADLLIGYDAAGGYGHRDHLAVHAVARRTAELTGVRLVEATAPREIAVRVLTVTSLLRLTHGHDVRRARTWFTPSRDITHRIDVRRQLRAKQRAVAEHHTEAAKSGRTARLQRLTLRVPSVVLAPLFGTEFFVEPGHPGHATSLF
ncbi:PIG-L family deacetylase [Tsukamurella sp. 8F]|uniref:PIG-L deacetylase family protein n=1 Tax=unclassified Tsukamurella TaxID=2633480 RepID=UPI0023B9B403|nr:MULTISPECIES: PIG-L family deacetylase [unclassified Tsukamurella]MDF0529247.1 PIG-L family deacetylase [Tsukamurella sp. 8J]MDF0585432.1 PIG-L family deacetylase [Tsukamurella sp. 8F]